VKRRTQAVVALTVAAIILAVVVLVLAIREGRRPVWQYELPVGHDLKYAVTYRVETRQHDSDTFQEAYVISGTLRLSVNGTDETGRYDIDAETTVGAARAKGEDIPVADDKPSVRLLLERSGGIAFPEAGDPDASLGSGQAADMHARVLRALLAAFPLLPSTEGASRGELPEDWEGAILSADRNVWNFSGQTRKSGVLTVQGQSGESPDIEDGVHNWLKAEFSNGFVRSGCVGYERRIAGRVVARMEMTAVVLTEERAQ